MAASFPHLYMQSDSPTSTNFTEGGRNLFGRLIFPLPVYLASSLFHSGNTICKNRLEVIIDIFEFLRYLNYSLKYILTF